MNNIHKSFEEQQKEKILKSYNGTEDLIKGGEGSRGGKIIGHTKSGKAIYENSRATHVIPDGTSIGDHYDSFSKQDHLDAAKLHREHKVMNARGGNPVSSKKHRQAQEYHQGEADNFVDISTEKELGYKDTSSRDKQSREYTSKNGTIRWEG